jgi:cyclic pyranopterin monophosphate synthase
MSDTHPEAAARMVDISGKEVTARRALAVAVVRMSPGTRDLILQRELPKGDALETARVAGIMAAKKTADLIPLCHPISLSSVDVSIEPAGEGFEVSAEVKSLDRTGVEMEALTAVSIAALTLYDMVKGVERAVEITAVRLLEKSGGRSGDWSLGG